MMLKTHSLKAALNDLQKVISKTESLIQDYEDAEISAVDQKFYDLLNLPANASAFDFFRNMKVGTRMQNAVVTFFIVEYLEMYRKWQNDPDFFPKEMRAVNGYIWLKNFDPKIIRGHINIGKKSMAELDTYLTDVENLLDDEL